MAISPKGIALLQQRPEFEVVVLPKRLSEAELLPVVKDVVAMVVRSESAVSFISFRRNAGPLNEMNVNETATLAGGRQVCCGARGQTV